MFCIYFRIKNLTYEEDRSLLDEHHITYLENRIIHADLAEEIAKINDKVFSYIKRKEYLIKKHNFYSELLDEKMMDCVLEILPQAFK